MSGKSKFEACSQQIFSVSLLMTKDKVKLRRQILACKPQNTFSQANNLYPHPLFVNIIIITITKYPSLWGRPCSLKKYDDSSLKSVTQWKHKDMRDHPTQ